MSCKTQKEAEIAAAALFEKLDDKEGWTINVWENMGWHYSASKGAMTVFSTIDGTYKALLSDDAEASGYGLPEWSSTFSSDNPNEVIAEQLYRARQFVERCRKAISSVTGERLY